MDIWNKDKTTRFLTSSIIMVCLFCVAIFCMLGFYINRNNADTIQQVGHLYMSGITEQISMHYESVVELRLSQVEALVKQASPEEMGDEEIKKDLSYRASIRGFEHLAFYSSDGTFEMLSGNSLQVIDPPPFLKSLCDNQEKVAVGLDGQGNKVILFGIPTDKYNMSNGKKCVALVAALPVEYFSEMLALEEGDALVYSHIIRPDGSFVIQGAGMERVNYLDGIREEYGENNKESVNDYILELRKAMKIGKDYFSVFQADGKNRQISGTSLPYSEWYLVSVMPYGELDQTIDHMSTMNGSITLGACIVILFVLGGVFLQYFRFTRRQIVELEQARSEALQATKAKSEFLSNMSHDIRTPMNAIVGMTAIAMANFDNQEQVKNCLKKITLSSKHLLGLINDILDMSKIESGKMTLNMDRMSLKEVIDSIVSIVQPQVKAKKQNFDVVIHDISTENVYCDSVRLNQVLLNFLSNAVKFTPEGGFIKVVLYEEESPKGQNYVQTHIIVSDSGIGMSPEFVKKIFESYVREDNTRVRKTEGAGLGMAITKYIVDAMGGTIDIHSEQGKGSEFHVTLELEKAYIQEADMILPEWNMLVVDDDELLCQTTVSSLNDIGISADWTMDGESAIGMVEKHHERGDDYQIILLDWKLPGLDGVETARVIRRKMGENIPILLISAYDWSEIEDIAREAGVTGFISKPLFKSTLFYGLRKYMDVEELQEEQDREEIHFTGKRILVAEDNELNWEIVSELLGSKGLELAWAENGKQCADMFAKSPKGYYDAVLMDIRMPVMTGYEATKEIRSMNREDADIPIIAMTADAFAEDIKKCRECGMNAHIAKPIDIDEVLRFLKRYF